VVTPAAVAQLIANLSVSYPGDTPPAGQRLLRVRLTEAAPNPGTGSATRPLTVIAVNDPPLFAPSAVTVDAMIGVPLIGTVRATDPDLPTGAALTYATATPGLSLTAAGVYRYVPTTVGMQPFLITASDDVGGVSNLLTLTINVLDGPTISRPYVITDPPVEIGEGEIIFHPFTITPARGAPTAVTVALLGDAPTGAWPTLVSTDKLVWALTAPAVAYPADGVYTFGMRLVLSYPTGPDDIGWQPITLVVRSLKGTN
jgi:hypothetical protein